MDPPRLRQQFHSHNPPPKQQFCTLAKQKVVL